MHFNKGQAVLPIPSGSGDLFCVMRATEADALFIKLLFWLIKHQHAVFFWADGHWVLLLWCCLCIIADVMRMNFGLSPKTIQIVCFSLSCLAFWINIKLLYSALINFILQGRWTLESDWLTKVLRQGSSNISLEVQSAAEFSSNPDQAHRPVIF